MNKSSIDTARDADLRLSLQAMQRAAHRAKDLAARTGTAIVIGRGGVVEHIRPPLDAVDPRVREPLAPYGDPA